MSPAGVFSLRDRVELLLTRFRLAMLTDKAVERRARWYLVGAIAGGIVSIVMLATLSDHFAIAWTRRRSGETAFYGFFLVTPLLLTALAIWRRVVWHRLDFDDRKLRAVVRLLAILRADIPRNERVRVRVDFRAVERGGQVVSRQGIGVVRTTRYRHAWLALTARLADGNTVTLTVTDRMKVKTKRKGRRRELCASAIGLTVRLDKRYRPSLGALADLLRRRPSVPITGLSQTGVPLKAIAVRTGARDRVIKAVIDMPRLDNRASLADGDMLLRTVQWFYAGLHDTRRSA